MNFSAGCGSDFVIEVSGLSRRFDVKLALNNVSLRVARGEVFGLVGENGAGKTTLIKHFLGLLKSHTGVVRVFGLDPVADPAVALSRIGYLSEQRDLPGWMRVEELIRFSQAFYPEWDPDYASQLCRQFLLEPKAQIRNLSRGEAAKAGLLTALAHRPELLLLDEPSSGLDPVVRRDILEAIIRTVAEEGRTVFFSSHLLDEIERVCDTVAMMVRGEIILCGPLDQIKENHVELVLRFPSARTEAPQIPEALTVQGLGSEWTVLSDRGPGALAAAAEKLGARVIQDRRPSLNEIFVAHCSRRSQTLKTSP